MLKDILDNLNGGKLVWNCLNPNELLMDDLPEEALSQDILQIKYESCIIDVGYYYTSAANSYGHFTIQIILSKEEEWNPVINIPCESFKDMEEQLKRAIRIYPEMCKIY